MKFFRNDQHWWLVCFPVFCVCFFLGSRIFVICYKSKYSLDMLCDWKFSEMITIDDWYVFLYSVYVFSWDPGCLWFVTNLNIAQICFMIKNSQKWYIMDQQSWLVCFSVFYVCFVCPKASIYVFSMSKSFCKSCISPEYTNCDNSHFSWSSFVLQLLRATRWCRNIFPIFSKKFHLN